MELRQTEAKVNELHGLYQQLKKRSSSLPWLSLPPLDDDSSNGEEEQDTATEDIVTMPLTELGKGLQEFQSSVTTLQEKVKAFERKLKDTDPITGASRYGPSTSKRVELLIQKYQPLLVITEETLPTVLETLQGQIQKQHEEQRQREILSQQEAERQLQSQQEELKQQQERLEEQRLAQQVVERQEQDALHRAAIESRQARQEAEERQELELERARREQQERDQRWMASIPKGSMEQQLELLRQSTSHDAEAQKRAVRALHTVFVQIVARPEEVQFRRIRRNHEQFHNDIGQYKGGPELLIASGFRLGAIDNVPCFISTEPNLEKDMDAWSEWFDLLKATVGVLENAI